jgi:hypothetical protein
MLYVRARVAGRIVGMTQDRAAGVAGTRALRAAGARAGAGLAVACLLAIIARNADAQSAGRGFLFKEPVGSFTLRGGFDHANAGSDLFAFTTKELTISRGDFSGPTLAADLAFVLTPRLDIVFSAGYSGTNTPSEFRGWVDQDNLPIEQTTTFQRVPLTMSLKAYLAPRGRTLGQFAWVPAKYSPFVGIGGGAMWYQFKQSGDWVDFQTNDVFPETLQSARWTPTAHILAGMDYSLSPRFALTGEGKYAWAKGNVSGDFDGFDKIDLSGFTATLGFFVRF